MIQQVIDINKVYSGLNEELRPRFVCIPLKMVDNFKNEVCILQSVSHCLSDKVLFFIRTRNASDKYRTFGCWSDQIIATEECRELTFNGSVMIDGQLKSGRQAFAERVHNRVLLRM